MRNYPPILQKIIEDSGLNLNQISQASGISNPYLAKLAKGRINRPGKDKIASIMLALNYTISDIEATLSGYGYPALSLDDIPPILKNNRARKIIGGSRPHYDHIYNDLLLVVLEHLGGRKILVKDRPSGVFMPHELYLLKEYPYEANNAAETFRYELTRALLTERSQAFVANCRAGYETETYICRRCFSEYIERNFMSGGSPRRRELILRYLANALSLSLKFPRQHQILLMERCPYFDFLLQDADGETPKVSYPGKKIHFYDNDSDKRILEGFTTDIPQTIRHFQQEIDMCRKAVEQNFVAEFPRSLHGFLLSQLAAYGVAEHFTDLLKGLLDSPTIDFY